MSGYRAVVAVVAAVCVIGFAILSNETSHIDIITVD